MDDILFTLQNRIRDGTISLEDTSEITEFMKKENELKNYVFPQKPSTDGFYHIAIKDASRKGGRRQFKAKTIDQLKDKVYTFVTNADPTVVYKPTFKLIFKEACKARLSYVKRADRKISVQNTITRNERAYERFFADSSFERLLINQITTKNIEDIFYKNLQKYNLRKHAFATMCGIVSSTMRYAFEQDYIQVNPYLKVNISKFKDMIQDEVPITSRVHSQAEIDAILDSIHEYQRKMPRYTVAYALECQILVGMRKGEVPPLLWEDINFEDGVLYIHQEQLVQYKKGEHEKFIVVNHTKTNKNRWFPINDALHEFLLRLKEVDDKYYTGTKYLFPDKNGKECIKSRNIYQLYKRICHKLRIELSYDHIKGTHSFRRNAITKTVNKSGGDLVLAAQLYGNSPKVIEQHYFTGVDLEVARKMV